MHITFLQQLDGDFRRVGGGVLDLVVSELVAVAEVLPPGLTEGEGEGIVGGEGARSLRRLFHEF
jgi:hypothetical protein